MLVAQGGTANGYALFLAGGRLHFIVRSRAGGGTASTAASVAGAHTAIARVDAAGTLTLSFDGQPAVSASARGPTSAMPSDGLEVGSDDGGAVGPYQGPNPFGGSIESIVIDLAAP